MNKPLATPKSTLDPLERRVLTRLLKSGLKGEKWVVAVSGGLDSVVLAFLLKRISVYGKWDLVLAHVHHGKTSRSLQNQFRQDAQEKVQELAKLWNLPMSFRKSENDLQSEAEARSFRHASLKEILKGVGARRVVMAHHKDDLLETRLIRLVRGVGPQGLKSMSLRSGRVLRPFLLESRAELMRYAKCHKLAWVDDPSNRDSRFLRNWMRQEWIPQLEKMRPGSADRLARSLELMAQQIVTNNQGANRPETKVHLDVDQRHSARWSRVAFSHLSDVEKGQMLSFVFHKLQAPRVSQGRIDEVKKRIDSTRHRQDFHVGGLDFELHRSQVVCRRP